MGCGLTRESKVKRSLWERGILQATASDCKMFVQSLNQEAELTMCLFYHTQECLCGIYLGIKFRVLEHFEMIFK